MLGQGEDELSPLVENDSEHGTQNGPDAPLTVMAPPDSAPSSMAESNVSDMNATDTNAAEMTKRPIEILRHDILHEYVDLRTDFVD